MMKQTNFPDATKRNRLKIADSINVLWIVYIIFIVGLFGCIAIASLYAMIEYYIDELAALISLTIIFIIGILSLFWIALSVGTGTAEKDFKQFEE